MEVLKAGCSARVPAMLRDSASDTRLRIGDAYGRTDLLSSGSRAGFRLPVGNVEDARRVRKQKYNAKGGEEGSEDIVEESNDDDDNVVDAKEQAYRDADAYNANAWRGTDAVRRPDPDGDDDVTNRLSPDLLARINQEIQRLNTSPEDLLARIAEQIQNSTERARGGVVDTKDAKSKKRKPDGDDRDDEDEDELSCASVESRDAASKQRRSSNRGCTEKNVMRLWTQYTQRTKTS